MHLKNPLIFSLMAILLLGGAITPSIAQSSPNSDLIVINEVETNPQGPDAGYGAGGSGINSKTSDGSSGGMEYVELYNPTGKDVSIGGWSIVPSATWKEYVIPDDTVIPAKSFVIFSHVNYWFKDFGELVSLYDNAGNLIDETPLLVDKRDDGTSWQRLTDGFQTNSESDWELKRVTPKSSNGSAIEIEESTFTLSGQTDKLNYNFGEYVTISGTVSEKLFTEKPFFSAEIIKISIQGPNYYKNLAIFPDRSLNYSTTLNVQEVYGFENGEYDVQIVYGGHFIQTNFSIGNESESVSSEQKTETLELFTNKESYIPGEIVILSGETNSSIEYGGLEYFVTNPEGKTVFEGTIFPNESFSTVYQSGGGQLYPFSTQLFMATVNPVYGTYEIQATYKSQNPMYQSAEDEISASGSFVVVEDVKEDVAISITTDKQTYSVDDVIKVSGRSNDVWTEDLEIVIQQTSIYHRTTSTSSDKASAAIQPFTLSDSIRLDGDGRFSFEFKVIESTAKLEDYSHAYGDYKIKILDEGFGDASIFIKIVEDPESYTDVRTPLGLKSDKSNIILGTPVKISGTILDYDYKISNNLRNAVELTLRDDNGKIISYQDHQGNPDGFNCNTNDCEQYSKPLIFSAIPDSVGNFEVDVVTYPGQFNLGTYTVTANHYASKQLESITFEIISAQDEILQKEDEQREPITLDVEKDVFYVGEKLFIQGNVILKDPRMLDQSSTHTSAGTQSGSSYATNYAQAAMNYVEVSIPYPKSMSIVKSSNYKTIPDADENYTGGGGSGAGGAYYIDEDGNVVRGDEDKKQSADDRQTGYDGTAILQKQKKLLTNMNFKAYPDKDGNYSGLFELRAGVFSSGTYVVKANYYGYQTEQLIQVIDNSLKGGLSPEIILNFDKTEYIPGETVQISGKIANTYYYDMVSILVETPDVSQINCFAGQQCGFGNTEKKLRVIEGVEGPQFFMNYKLPSTENSVGSYTVTVDTHFGELKKEFFVVDESEIIGEVLPPTTESSESPESPVLISKKIIEKFNRIPDNKIPITLGEKSSDDSTLAPRVLQGSLFTSARGEESDVNLRITTSNGQCVIGQDSDCLVTESTRKPGAIYSIVSIDDINYKIRYSGNDVRLEKFSIVPEESGSQIDIDNWNVEIIKDEQPSRFYYKVSYVALE